ncbi:CDP-alcohol phosphatidyltransferase family protein [Fodinicola feengrottensis]|uniref:CDP-alcohol phosphatidyltransferase family protein n=1 Tax=Fodinicola feengrottensis TaxID=435914 RepID=UPI0013D78774|nr:CDP-alcohol phosphatidyltransferase family protein [Fodinicola feengrottensis]
MSYGRDRAADPLPDHDGYLDRWSALHGGWRPTGVFPVGWFRVTYALAVRPARRGLHPHVVTGLGLALSAAVPLLGWAGGGWAMAAVPVLICCGLADSVDGAVAVMSGTASRFGAVLDSLSDRLGETVVPAGPGGDGRPAGAGGGRRSRRVSAGIRTSEGRRGWHGRFGRCHRFFERPIRIIVIAFAIFFAGAAQLAVHNGLPGVIAGTGTAFWLLLSLAGLGQILRAARSDLSER